MLFLFLLSADGVADCVFRCSGHAGMAVCERDAFGMAIGHQPINGNLGVKIRIKTHIMLFRPLFLDYLGIGGVFS